MIVRRIRSAKRAFPLPAIADLFLGKPEYYLLKVEVEKSNAAKICQCSLCGEIFQGAEVAGEHVFQKHPGDFFSIETVEGDPPSGAFPCIAKCGITGELLAPPNHHTYRQRVREIHAAKFPNMPFAEYEKKIETSDDQDAIEEWKRTAALRTEYRLKDDPDSEPMDCDAAHKFLTDNHFANIIKSNRRFIIPAKIAWSSQDKDLLSTYREAWNREKRFPTTLMHALRPALKHMRMHVFKVGPKETFISAVQPDPIAPEDSISPIREMLEFIDRNPRCRRNELESALTEEDKQNKDKIEKMINSIHWLVDCGHLIEFADGSLAIPHTRNRL